MSAVVTGGCIADIDDPTRGVDIARSFGANVTAEHIKQAVERRSLVMMRYLWELLPGQRDPLIVVSHCCEYGAAVCLEWMLQNGSLTQDLLDTALSTAGASASARSLH